jgi:signal transduction histidine kinase
MKWRKEKCRSREQLQTAGKSHIEVETFQYEDDRTCRILADRERIRQVFVHLLDNAVTFINSSFPPYI